MVLAQVAVGVAVRGDRHADARGQQAVRFARAVFGHHCEDDFAGVQEFQSGGAGNKLTIGRENRGDPNQVLSGDACVPQGQLEGCQTLTMLSDSLGEEDPLRDHVLAQFICLQWHQRISRKRKSNIAICERWVKSWKVSKKDYGSLVEGSRGMLAKRTDYFPAPTDAT